MTPKEQNDIYLECLYSKLAGINNIQILTQKALLRTLTTS